MRKFAFYGSLRKGMYNYSPDIQVLATVPLPGYKMRSLGAYPMCVVSDDVFNDNIMVDLAQIDSEAVCNGIDGMEIGAGYTPHTITYNEEDYTIYLFEEDIEDYELVKNGDWKKFHEEREAKRKDRWAANY